MHIQVSKQPFVTLKASSMSDAVNIIFCVFSFLSVEHGNSFFFLNHIQAFFFSHSEPAAGYQRYFQLCPQTKHERAASKQLLVNADKPWAAGQCGGLEWWVISTGLLFLLMQATLEWVQHNKQWKWFKKKRRKKHQSLFSYFLQPRERKRGTEEEIGREGDMIRRKTRQRGWGGESMRQGDRDGVGEGGGWGDKGLVWRLQGEQAAGLLSGVYREAFRDK